jgi:hypothetical protein
MFDLLLTKNGVDMEFRNRLFLALNSNTTSRLSSDKQEYSIHIFHMLISKRRYR